MSETALLESPARTIVDAARGAAARGGSPASAARIAQGLARCLRRFEESTQPAAAWNFSALNGDGSPVELAFSSSDDRLRYTIEVGGPELAAHVRAGAAVELCRLLGDVTPPHEALEFWHSLQTGKALRWGAWFGVRQGERADRFKLYLELPENSGAAAGAERFRMTPDSRLIMLGYDCGTGTYEYYFRQPPMHGLLDVDRLLRGHFQSERRGAVLEAFVALCNVPARTALRWINFGYSITPLSDDPEPLLTLFARSRSLGNVGRVREFFLEHERSAGKPASTYRDLLGSVPVAELPDHGTVGVSATTGGRVEVRVGISGAALSTLCRAR